MWLILNLVPIKSDILGSCKKPKNLHDNLTPKEREAIHSLIEAQTSGLIQIKPVDKGGGFTIMNLSDYVNEMSNQLKATFTFEDGTVTPFYEKVDMKSLETQKKSVSALLEKGFKQNFILKMIRTSCNLQVNLTGCMVYHTVLYS